MSPFKCSCRRVLLRVAGLVAIATAWPVAARAQVVRGVVVDEASGRPMPGTVVVLLDSAGKRLAGVLADDAGRYAIRIAVPGRYGVRAERIGFRAEAPTAVQLAAGETVEMRLVTRPVPVALAAVRVTAKTACVARASDGQDVSTVWDEARKALTATELTQRQELFSAQVMRYERTLDARTGKVTNYQTTRGSGVTRNPFVSLAAAELSANGFVRQTSTETIYYGPDAGVLLSDEFLGDHCFRLREAGGRRSSMIGLQFEPARGRDKPEITGTLWLDRKTAELQDLEYQYQSLPNLPQSVRSEDFGGRIEFHRMPTGAWIVERWVIRMPVLVDKGPLAGKTDATVPGVQPTKPERIQLAAIREEGGEVTQTIARGQRRETALETSTVRGMVFDSTRMEPLPNARVFLDGTQFAARTDANGRFTIAQVPAGSYTLSVTHPRFDSLQLRPPSPTVDIRPNDGATAELTTPSPATIFARDCAPEERRTPMTALRGRVTESATGQPAIAAQVTLTWNQLVSTQVNAVAQRQIATRTDSAGRYAFCGLPDGVRLTVRVATEELRSAPLTVIVAPEQVSVFDLDVGKQAVVASAEPAKIAAPVTPAPDPRSQALRDFDRRRRRGTGTFMSRAQIEKSRATRLTDLLRTMPGVSVGSDDNGVLTVELRRSKSFTLAESPPTPSTTTPRDSTGGRAENGNNLVTGQMSIKRCPAAFLLDGMPIDGASGIDSQLRPEDIEGLEVYSGGQVPIEYGARHSECGVVMIWTRAAAQRSGELEHDGGH